METGSQESCRRASVLKQVGRGPLVVLCMKKIRVRDPLNSIAMKKFKVFRKEQNYKKKWLLPISF